MHTKEKIHSLVAEVITSYKDQLSEAGLTVQVEPVFFAPQNAEVSSEITINVFAENDLVDILEFDVYANGQPIKSKEITDWLGENLDNVITYIRSS